MSQLGSRAERPLSADDVERIAVAVRSQIVPGAALLEPLSLQRLLRVPVVLSGPHGQVRFRAFELELLPRHVWATTWVEGSDARIGLHPIAWEEAIADVPRSRFSLAHELAHVVLHTPELRGHAMLDYTDDPDDGLPWELSIEGQANRFAAHLLAPDAALAAMADRSLGAMMRTFGLGPKAARNRLGEFYPG